ncbi:uncharacterized protein [Bemisia tabaci]|uniref:uncharacterized protein isoform X2 n=1 Tax=Bemisia tabaci TaxID=7038 RepID=UPI003B281C2C
MLYRSCCGCKEDLFYPLVQPQKTMASSDEDIDEYFTSCWRKWNERKRKHVTRRQPATNDVAAERSRLFAPYENRSTNMRMSTNSISTDDIPVQSKKRFGPFSSKSRKTLSSNRSNTIASGENPLDLPIKQVILLRRSNKVSPPELGNMHHYYDALLVEDSMVVSKKDTASQIKFRLSLKFPKHLLNKEFDILKKEGRKLVAPKTSDLNGAAVAIIFHNKKMFLRPAKNLDLPPDLEWNSEDEDIGSKALYASSSKKYQGKSSTYVPKTIIDDAEEFAFDTSEPRFIQIGPNKRLTSFPTKLSDYNVDLDDDSNDSCCTQRWIPSPTEDKNDIFQEKYEKPDLSFLISVQVSKVSGDSQESIYVYRDNIWASTVLGLGNPNFSPLKKLYIVFMDEYGREDGIDAGALKQEFFSLNLEAVRKSDMFFGPEFERDLNHSKDHCENNHYYMMGVLIALSFSYNGSQPQFFSTHLFNDIISGTYQRKLIPGNLRSFEIQAEVEAIKKMESSLVIKDYIAKSSVLNENSEINWVQKFTSKEAFIQDIMEYYINKIMQEPFHQLIEGLKTLDLLDSLRENPDVWKSCFVKPVIPLTADHFRTFIDVEWSEDPTIKKDQVPNMTFFFYFINELEHAINGYSISDLLMFATGYQTEPAGGLIKKIKVKFLPNDGSRRYPEATACSFELYLPTWPKTLNDFKEYFYTAFKAKGFTKEAF